MVRRAIAASALALLLGVSAVAQPVRPESPAETIFQSPSVALPLDENPLRPNRTAGAYATAGFLLAPPIMFKVEGEDWFGALAPVPAPWATLGMRNSRDVAWQTSFLLVPMIDPHSQVGTNFMITTGFDLDRVSTNRSRNPNVDRRWQAGARIVGIGFMRGWLPLALGPHIGLRTERPIGEGLALKTWADVGVLPNLGNGIPLIDLRGEISMAWRPPRIPGMSVEMGLFNEVVGFFVAGFMTPGLNVRIGWNY